MSLMNASEYDLDFFRENGFVRGLCPKCGRHFWSQGDWETCGEPPCDEYTFIDASPMAAPMDVHKVREEFQSFFERNGHTRVARYPIVARWRKDVFFTQASIYNFQPYVIDRIIEPPANPLTISQTCVRFNDIDNVGKTGRHFTFFEMMAHHAFNWPGNQIYFKDRTAELCHRLFTEHFATDPQRLRYIEEWWEGGGNSGPCLEVMLDGVEVATLVFMMYRETPTGRVPLDMHVVDTGYGLERIAWVSQGTSSAYEAVFGSVVADLKSRLGLEPDHRVLLEYSKVAGATNMHTAADVRRIREETANRIGISFEELMQTVAPLENVYVVCDHSRALAFMLNDAVVPSNVREGYFARLLIRRALRSMHDLSLDLSLSSMVSMQIDYYAPYFPEMEGNRDDILNLIDVEERRYHETLSRGRQLVSRMTQCMDADEVMDIEMLIELYDSHGLSPEIVQEFATVRVEIPDDFYIKVAERHETPDDTEIQEDDGSLGSYHTDPLYYEDPEMVCFTAKVLAHVDGGLVLDRTAFYPEGGGQECDLGSIDGRQVTNVQQMKRTIVHHLEHDELPDVGDEVIGMIDLDRRQQLMAHHTAAHIINGVCHRMFGNHIWQTGAHKSVDEARLDITHFENLEDEQVRELELGANQVILDDLPVNIEFMDRDAAEALHGFRLYQGGVVPGKTIRVVDIPGLDAEACGGVHVSRTSHVGQLRIIRTRRIQDGVVRVEYTAGMAAVRMMQADRVALDALMGSVNVLRNEVPSAVTGIMSEHRETQKALDRMTRRYNKIISRDLADEAPIVNGVRVITHVTQPGEDPAEVSKRLSSEPDVISIIAVDQGKPRLLVARGRDVQVDCRELLRSLMTVVGGGGGGKPDFAQGGGGDASRIPEALNRAAGMVKDQMNLSAGHNIHQGND